MRAIILSRHGGPDVLEVRDLPDPVPGDGEVRVFAFEEITEAHRLMDRGQAGGKLVVEVR